MRAKELIIKESDLFEIDMSPSSLQRLAKNIDARAGMEFEMIVPETDTEDEAESEPNYDSDERAHDIDSIIEFFHDGDWNSRHDVARLRNRLREDYEEWMHEQLGDAWERNGRDFLKDFIDNNDLFDHDEALMRAREEVMDANPEMDTDSEDFQNLLSYRVNELENEFVENEWEEGIQGGSNIYDQAQEEFNDEMIGHEEFSESDWLHAEGLRYMSDIENSYGINWPHWTQGGGGGGRGISEVADSFEYAIGKPINYSERYHGARREPGKYVVEPDGSLEGDNPGDAGLEFVSPPMPLPELIDDLMKVKRWAEENNCYTNESTGLHMNISVPNWSGNIQDLDYVKLALLLGDQYILDQFGRSGNTYAKSALEIVKRQAQQRPEDVKVLMDKMREHLNTAAAKMIHTGVTSKYTSINVKDGYIEFRSPGGDWLGENFDLITNTLLRFVVAMDAAVDPQKYRTEYLKKLYAILQPKDANDPIAYFAQYSAGQLPKQALKSFIRQAQLQRKVEKTPASGEKYWWNVQWDETRRMEVVASSKEVAIQVAAEEWGVPESRLAGAIVTPLRPYQGPETSRTEPIPGSTLDLARQRAAAAGSQTDMENRLGWSSQSADANYEIVDRRTNRPVFLFIANTETEAWSKYGDWLAASGYPEDTEDFGWRPRGARGQHARSIPASNQSGDGEFTGQWQVMYNGEELTRISGIGNSQADANRVGREYILQQIRSGQLRPVEGAEIEVVPVMR